jgi:hypothetical protein
MISFLLIVLFTLALFHWAYEAAIAPSVRLGTRYRLFALRDELRNFVARNGVKLNDPAIQLLEESINSTIEYMPGINFGFILAFHQRCSSDESFRKRVEYRRQVIEAFEAPPEFHALRKRFEHIFRDVTILNGGGWFVYLVPIALVGICWEWLRRLIVRLCVVPFHDFPALSRGMDEASAEPA